jgi:hypothetical protein
VSDGKGGWWKPDPAAAKPDPKVAEAAKAAEAEIDKALDGAQWKDPGLRGEVKKLALAADKTPAQRAEAMLALAKQYDTQIANARTAQVAEWAKALPMDREVGGEKFKQSVADAQQVLQKHGDTELQKLLDESGVGNHPAVFRLLARIGKWARESTSEDSSATRTGPAGSRAMTDQQRTQHFYGSAKPKSLTNGAR